MSAKWQRLRLSYQGDLPPVLFRYLSTSSGYELYMTDLTHIWSEHLNHKEILKRADEDDATIDPSEDRDQFKVLLQKIGDALNNESGSHVTLNHNPSMGNSLSLTTSTELPAPLKPLEWTIYLSQEPQTSLASHLLFPLLKAEAGLESRQRTLVDQLSKKDWVLGKLFDKIEAVGIDLSTIFPGTPGLRTGRKGTTLAQAAKHIKGLAPFDERAWLDEVNKSSPDSDLAASILAEISGSDGSETTESLHPPPERWWEKLTGATTAPPKCEDAGASKQPKPPQDDAETGTDAGTETDDDDFERQETPPNLKRSKGTVDKSPSPKKDQKTDEKSTNNSPSPSPQKPLAKPSKGLGMIGGRKQTKKPTPQPSPSPDPTNTPQQDDEQTDSGSDHEGPNPTPPEQPKSKLQEKPPAKRGGLGVIGGKKKEPQAPPPPQPSSSASPEPERSTPAADSSPPATEAKPASKLGVIGGKASKPSASLARASPKPQDDNVKSAEDTSEKNNPPVKSQSPEDRQPKIEEPTQEETEQERADRKREELKRQLEAKSKAPVKKKRKF